MWWPAYEAPHGGVHTVGWLSVSLGALALAESPCILCPSSLPDATHGHVFLLSVWSRVTKVYSATNSDSVCPPCASQWKGSSLVLIGGSDGALLAVLLLPLPSYAVLHLICCPNGGKQSKRFLGGLADLCTCNSVLTCPGPIPSPVSVSALQSTQQKAESTHHNSSLWRENTNSLYSSSNPSSQYLFFSYLPQMYAPMTQRPMLGASHHCPPKAATFFKTGYHLLHMLCTFLTLAYWPGILQGTDGAIEGPIGESLTMQLFTELRARLRPSVRDGEAGED